MTPGRLLVAVAAVLSVASARAEWSTGGHEVPLDGNGRSWVVHATLNGTLSGLFLLDTGASYCVLAPTTARRLGLRATGEQLELHTANGVVRAPVVYVRTLDVGGSKVRDVPAVVHGAVGPPLDGVIGLSYLNNFSYAVDPQRRVLRLR